MDNCDLERLSFSGWKLQPAFRADVTNYKVTVASHVTKVTMDLRTSDCGASYRILFGDCSKTLRLNDGVNQVEIEVVAEDGTTKKYRVEITKLSATAAELSDLTIDGNVTVPLHPEFDTRIYEYNSTVPFYCNSVTMLPKLPDKDMTVFVNEDDITKPVLLNVGDTVVVIRVSSADGTNLQVYTVFVTREPIPMAVTFSDGRDQVAFECPVSLTALYRPISIHPSYPKHVFSGPYIEMLVRRSKVDPLNECPLGDGWKVLEPELDKKMSAGLVKCFFAYRGCDHVMKLSEVGSHALDCPRRPRGELDIKDVADTDWYKQHFTTSTSTLLIETLHTLEVRTWERRLQKAVRQGIVDDLCTLAQDQLKLYRQRLPKPGDLLQYEDGENPLEILEQAAVYFASAIKLKSREARLHFLLGQTLEEHHYAMGMYGLKKVEGEEFEEHSEAKVLACHEEILAVCKLHGLRGTLTLENQLRALDKEYHQLKDNGLTAKADHVQTLYLWLSKKAGKDCTAAVKDTENCVQHALMKYLDAWTLSPDNWEYNLHVGRLLLLQGQSKEALQHLQTGLALRPVHPALRFYTGLALLQQEARASEATEKQAALFLQQGLAHLLSKHCRSSDVEWDPSDPVSSLNTQFLRGVLSLGELQQRKVLKVKSMTAEQVYHIVAVLTAQAVSQCVCRGEVTRQLEWVLLEAHFALLQRLIHHRTLCQENAGTDRQVYLAKRSQALMALTRLTSIAPCQELLDMQEKVCQVAVVTVPRDAHALCILGLAQLAQSDNEPDSIRSKIALANACMSFRASIELEGQSQSGEPPAQLHEQKWWQERLKWWQERQDVDGRKAAKQTPSQLAGGGKGPSDTAAAGRGSGRGKGGPSRWVAAAAKAPTTTSTSTTKGGKAAPPAAKPPTARKLSLGRGGAAAKANGAAKPGAAVKANGAAKPPSKPGSKTLLSRSKSRPDCDSSSAERTEEPATVNRDHSLPSAVNRRSHMARLGLARALSRSARSLEKAKKLYYEVISMAPRVHDSYIELAQLLEPSDALAAVGVYCKYPLKPAVDQSRDDAFITGEIVRLLMKLEMFDHHQLGPCLIAHAKIMGAVCIEKYIDILDAKFMTRLLKTVYAGLHDKSEDDKDLQDFFKFKGWI